MKVGLIADTFSVEVGTGIARYNTALMEGLSLNGIQVKPICPAPVHLPMGDVIKHTIKLPVHMLKNYPKLDLFHATSPVNALYFPITKKPHVVTYHDLASILYRTGGRTHVTSTAPYFYRLGKYSDRIISVSSQTKQELIKYLHFPEEKITVINHGIDERFIRLPKNDQGIFHIGYVGSMVARKRIDYLINAFNLFIKKYPEIKVKLSIYGKKSHEYDRLSGLVKSLDIVDKVTFHGQFSDADLVKIYNSMDVMVIASDTEGFGIPILEAQRCGVPVIVRKGASIPDEVIQCCLKASSEEDIADNIRDLLTNNGFREKIIRRGYDYSKTFTWDKMVKATMVVYDDILKSC